MDQPIGRSGLTVTRMHGWYAVSQTNFQFEVSYTSDNSGESVRLPIEMFKQPDGGWLFKI